MLQAKVNKADFKIEVLSNEEVVVNSDFKKLDIIELSDTRRHVILNNKSFLIEFFSFEKEKKEMTLKVNNKTYKVELKDKYDLLLKEMGMSDLTKKVIKEVKAPMPGLVVSIEVKEGDEVKTGEPLIVLEAMKMENVLKSPIDGIVKNVKIDKSSTVDKNTVLIEFE